MYEIHVTSLSREVLPERMLYSVKRHRKLGCLKNLVHVKDDLIIETEYGWEMISYWDTPEETV